MMVGSQGKGTILRFYGEWEEVGLRGEQTEYGALADSLEVGYH